MRETIVFSSMDSLFFAGKKEEEKMNNNEKLLKMSGIYNQIKI